MKLLAVAHTLTLILPSCAVQDRWDERPLLPEWVESGRLELPDPTLAVPTTDPGLWRRLSAAPTAALEDSFDALTSKSNWALLGSAVLLGEVAERSRLNDHVRQNIYEVDHLDESTDHLLDLAGNGAVLLGAGAGIYAWGLAMDDPKHEAAGIDALASLGATGLTTLALKALIHDPRPRGGNDGYPSGHTSMSVAFATSLHQSYGWEVAMPAYLLSGLVAFQRLDSGAHELDDVLVGAALGFIIARQVHRSRLPRFLGADVAPFYDASNDATGISLGWGW